MTLGILSAALLGAACTAVAWRITAIRAKNTLKQHLQTLRSRRATEVRAMTKGLTHELKNPLSTIALNADLLREAVNDLEQLEEADRAPISRRTKSIQREAERLTGILQDFERFAGEIRLHLAAADLNSVADELVDFFAPQAAASQIRIRADLNPTPLIAEVDTDQLKQALLNLVLNATQAMKNSEDHGAPKELILRTRPAEPLNNQPAAAIHVIDTGPGIPETIQASMFDPYFTTKPSGSGIGLAITRRIIEEHNGSLTVFTEEGRGTDFQVTVPLVSA